MAQFLHIASWAESCAPEYGDHEMNLKLAFVAAIMMAPSLGSAATLTLDTGWDFDTLSSVPGPTDNSPWTFTIAGPATFSLTDDFIVGDTYFLSGDITGTSTFYVGANDVRATGTFAAAWLNPAYSKFSAYLGAGTYTFRVTGDGVGGVPASLGLRLDSAVPEPASWVMLIAGFGLIGATMRRRSLQVD